MKHTLLESLAGSFSVALGLSLTSSAHSVRVVDAAGGPGSGFTTIGAAVAASANGDFVLVRAGSYFEVVHLDGKGLVMQARPGVIVDAIEIENLGAGQFAALRGFERWFGD